MSLVCFASFKGSPGTTITALAAAATWPTSGNRRKLLLEADADGGTLALRYRLPTKPGLLSLAAATRHGLTPEQLWDHAQSLPGGLPVVLGPEGPEQATEVLRSNGRELGQWLRSLPGVDVIADVGRLSLGSAAFELARSADAVLAVARPEAVQLQPAAQRLTALGPYGPRVGWVLIGDKPYSVDAVTEAYGLPVVHVVAEDRRGASLMESGSNPKKLRRSTLVRSVTGLSEALVEWLHPLVDEEWAPPEAAESESDPAPAPMVAEAPVAPPASVRSPNAVPVPTIRSTEVPPPLAPAGEQSEAASIPAPDPDARRPPSLAIIAAQRGRDLAGVENDKSDVEPHRNGTA
ncbi:MAG: hypothetical protein ACR2QO_16930 [Acidimicrobiales bacterium]